MFNGSVEENKESSRLNGFIKKELELNFKKIDAEVLSYLIGTSSFLEKKSLIRALILILVFT